MLDNGLRVVVAPLPHLHTATIAVFVRVGSRHEDPDRNGLSHFLEHMVFRGTPTHPSSYLLNLAIEELGGSLDGETSADTTVYSATVPPEHAEQAVRVLGDMLSAPTFQDLEIERRILREELLDGLDEHGANIDPGDAARRLVFAPHALGMPIAGTLENLERFGVEDLRRHLRRHYGARNLVLCASGDVDPAAVVDVAARAFGDFDPGEPTEDHPPTATGVDGRFLFVEHDDSQADVRVSFPTFGERDPRAPALHLLGRILDDGLSSRVPRRICDEKGLAYEAFASLETWSDAGVLDFGASVAHENAPEVVREIGRIVDELREQPIDPTEVDRARRRWLFHLRCSADDDLATAAFYGEGSLLGLDETPEDLAARIRSVTTEEVHQVARELLVPERLHLACVGSRGLERRLKALVPQ